jgi:hypothetical protein
MPVGGYKQSGVGRENGLTTLGHYTRIKSVQVELVSIKAFLMPQCFKPSKLITYAEQSHDCSATVNRKRIL